MGEQIVFLLFGNALLSIGVGQPGIRHLLEQTLHRRLHRGGELFDRNVSH